MAADLATLGLRLTNAQAVADAKATGAALEDMGVKGEAAARKVAGSANPVTEAIKKQAVTVQQARVAWAASGGDMHRFAQELQRAVAPVNQVATSLARVEPVAHAGRLSLGRLGQQFGNLAGQIAHTNPIVANLLSVLGNFAYGSVMTVGILGGIAAIALAYNKITEGARKAKEKAAELTASLVAQARAIFQATQAGATAVAWAAEQNLENVKKESGVGWRSVLGTMLTGKPTIAFADAEAQSKQIAAATKAVAQAWANVGKIVEETNEKIAAKAKEAFDKLKALREKDAAEEKTLNAQVAALKLKQTLDELRGIAEVQAFNKQIRQEQEQQERAAAQRRADEEERINKNLVREMQQTWSQFFSDTLSKGLSSFRDLFDGIKQLFFRLIGDMLAAGVMKRMAGVFGGIAAGTGSAGSGGMLSGLGAQMAGQAVMGGVAGGLVGYGVGRMTGSAAGGAITGAASGAAAGFMVAGPLGALAGGLTGLVGGLLGGAAAAREAAAAMRQLQKDYVAAIAAFSHDDLATALAQNAAQAEQLRKMVEALYSSILQAFGVPRPAAYQAELDRINREEQKNAEMIKRQTVYAQEDLVVRNLRATGQGSQADALGFQNQQAREMQAAIDANRDATYLSYLATVQNNELVAFQNGLLATAMRNAPTGFYGVERYLGQFATPTGPAGWPTDSGPPPPPDEGRPPDRLLPPRTGPQDPTPPIIQGPFTIQLMVDGRVLTSVVIDNLDQVASATGGAGSSRAEALELY